MNPQAVVGAAMPQGMGQGMNQMLELFKMQYLMKFLDSGKGGATSLMTMAVLMGWDQFARYIPMLFTLLWTWAQVRLLGKKPSTFEQPLKDAPLLTSPPPPQKSIRAFIQFERHPEKVADPRIDAVIHHVCNLPDVRSLRYNGVEMIPNFKDALMIDNDVWFEISNPNQQATMTLFGASAGSKDVKLEPILYRLSTYDHDITWLHKFVEQAMDTFEQEKKNKLGSETYYFDQIIAANALYKGICLFSKSKFTSNRTLNNVYLRQIGELQERVEFFMRRRDWYDSKGIPHTLGIVMYGHPGCGKTSTIKAIANQTKRHIFNIALSEIKTKEALKNLFYSDEVQVITNGKNEMLNIPIKHRLYVIEDIDAMNSVVIKRSKEQQEADSKHKLKVEAEMELLKQQQGEQIAKAMLAGKTESDTDKLDLATLLNVLDGVRETPGRIIILSTNYPERLDEALLRPGRFDMMLEFEKHSCEVLKQHIEKHYDIILTQKQLALVNTPSLNKKWTPAEVSQILFRRHTSADLALEDLLTEDPTKLFKFSQMAKKEDSTSESESKSEDAGTDLAKLLELETPEEATKSENEIVSLSPVSEDSVVEKKEDTDTQKRFLKECIEDYFKLVPDPKKRELHILKYYDVLQHFELDESYFDSELPNKIKFVQTHIKLETQTQKHAPQDDEDIGTISGGLSLVDPNPPTKEQIEAEVKTHKILFQEQYKDGVYIGGGSENLRLDATVMDKIGPKGAQALSDEIENISAESERKVANAVVTKDSVGKMALFDSNQLDDKFTDGVYGRRKEATNYQLDNRSWETETKRPISQKTLFNLEAAFGVAAANTNGALPPTSQPYSDPHLETLHSIEADFGLGAASSEEGPCSLEEAFSGQCISTEICAARDTTPLDLSRLGADRAALLMAMTKS